MAPNEQYLCYFASQNEPQEDITEVQLVGQQMGNFKHLAAKEDGSAECLYSELSLSLSIHETKGPLTSALVYEVAVLWDSAGRSAA